MEKEIEFRGLPGLEDRYLAGSDGFIYSLYRTNTPIKKSVRVGSGGYLRSIVWIDGKEYCRSLHVWICLAFHGPKPTPKHETRHLDGNKLNNRPDNLAWGTRTENAQDKKRHGTQPEGSNIGIAKFKEEDVRSIRHLYDAGEIKARQLIGLFGVNQRTMYNILLRKSYKNV